MSTQTTFDGMMEFDQDNLLARITKWLTELGASKADWPGTAVVLHRDPDSQSYQQIVELPLTQRPQSAAVLRDEIRAAIVRAKGPEPIGYFRVKISRKGERASPDVDFHRKVGDLDLNQRSMVDVWKELYQRERARTGELLQQMMAQHGSTTVMMGSWGSSMSTLASARATGSVGADMGSPMAILGMIAWVLFFPSMKRAMGLPGDADVLTVVKAGQVLLERAVRGEAAQVEEKPVFRIEDDRGEARAPATQPEAEDVAPAGPTWGVREVLDRAERDVAWRDELVDEMKRRPPLMARLKQLALEALASA